MGITTIVPHDFSYATAGVAKRDHPASYFFQQPYSPLSRAVYAICDRSRALIARAKYEADILVISPVYTAQAVTNGGDMALESFYAEASA